MKSNKQSTSKKRRMSRIAYSVPDAAKHSGIGRTSIYEALRAGSLKAKKMNNRTIILRSDLLTFLRSLPDYEPRSR